MNDIFYPNCHLIIPLSLAKYCSIFPSFCNTYLDLKKNNLIYLVSFSAVLGFRCWVGFPLVGVIVAYSSVQPQRLTVGPSLVADTGSGPGVSSSCSVWAQQLPFLGFKAQAQTKHGLSCLACGILLDEELNLCLLHWQTDFLPLSHQGSPDFLFVFFFFFKLGPISRCSDLLYCSFLWIFVS